MPGFLSQAENGALRSDACFPFMYLSALRVGERRRFQLDSWFVVVLCLVALLTGCRTAFEQPCISPSGDNGDKADWSLLVLRSHYCGECDVLESTLSDPRVRAALHGVSIVVAYKEEEPELARRFLTTAVPKMVFIRDGTPEAFLMGATPPEKLLEEWQRIRTGGPPTMRSFWAMVHADPDNPLVRAQLGIALALLGDIEGATLQLARIERHNPNGGTNLRGTIHTAKYLRLREDVQVARANDEVPGVHALLDLVQDTAVLPQTRYRGSRMSAGVLATRISGIDDEEDLAALRARRRLAHGIAWACAPRPLGEQERSYGLDVSSLLWTERGELSESDRDLARQIATDLQAEFSDDADVQVAAIRGYWLMGKHEEALQAARGLKDVDQRVRIIGELK